MKTGLELALTHIEKDPILNKYIMASTPINANDDKLMEILLDALDDNEEFIKPCPKSAKDMLKKKKAQKMVSQAIIEDNVNAVGRTVSRLYMVVKGLREEIRDVRRMAQRALMNTTTITNQCLHRQYLARIHSSIAARSSFA